MSRTLYVVNGYSADVWPNRYVLGADAYGSTYFLVWGSSLSEAFDEMIDAIAQETPGLLCDDQVEEEYARLIADGMSAKDAWEAAEVDTSCGGNCGNRIHSWEWCIVADNPDRAQLKALIKSRDLETVGVET